MFERTVLQSLLASTAVLCAFSSAVVAEEIVIRCEANHPIPKQVTLVINTTTNQVDDPTARPGANIERADQRTLTYTADTIAHEVVWTWRQNGGRLIQRYDINRASGEFRLTEEIGSTESHRFMGSCTRTKRTF